MVEFFIFYNLLFDDNSEKIKRMIFRKYPVTNSIFSIMFFMVEKLLPEMWREKKKL